MREKTSVTKLARYNLARFIPIGLLGLAVGAAACSNSKVNAPPATPPPENTAILDECAMGLPPFAPATGGENLYVYAEPCKTLTYPTDSTDQQKIWLRPGSRFHVICMQSRPEHKVTVLVAGSHRMANLSPEAVQAYRLHPLGIPDCGMPTA